MHRAQGGSGTQPALPGSQADTSIHHGKHKSSRCSTKARHGDLFTQGSNKTWEKHVDGIRQERGLGKAMQGESRSNGDNFTETRQ